MHNQYIALALLLVLVTIGAIVVLSASIIIKRRVTKRKGRISRAVYTSPGYSVSKVWREDISKKINATVKIRTEPQVFGPSYAEKYDEKPNGEIGITFIYRAKTADKFLELKNAILSVDSTLESPPLRNIRDFLLTARHHTMNPPPSCERINEYSKLYLWARHDLDPYDKTQYTRFCELHDRFMGLVARAAVAHIRPLVSHPSMPSQSGHSSRASVTNCITSSTKANVPSFTHSNSQGSTQSDLSNKSEQSRSVRLRSLSKSATSGLVLRRITYPHRKKHDPLVASRPGNDGIAVEQCQVFTNDIDLNDSTIDLHPTAGATVTSINQQANTSRRGSCRSDGSQTALIDFDSVISNPKTPSQTVRPTRRVDPFLQPELKTTVKYIKA